MRKVVFFLFVLFSFPAEAAPDKTQITVNYHPDEIRYIHKNRKIKCSQNKRGNVILGCARDKKRLEIRIDCQNRSIRLDVFSTEREIEIHSDLKEGSCEYKDVLEHEQTHMDLHAEALENILNRGMNDILDAFNGSYKKRKGCPAAVEAAKKAFNRFSQKYQREDRRINQEFDRDDADSVVLNCKPEPKVETFYDPPDITYVSAVSPQCRNKRFLCVSENGRKNCKPAEVSACTDMQIGFKTAIKTYLGQVDVILDIPKITTRISSAYRPGSCEYEALKNYELEKVDAIEEVLYDFMDGIIPDAEKAYSAELKKGASSQKLTDAMKAFFRNRFAELDGRFAPVERNFHPLTDKELKSLCKK